MFRTNIANPPLFAYIRTVKTRFILTLLFTLTLSGLLSAQTLGGLDSRTDALMRDWRGDRPAVAVDSWLRFAPATFDLAAGALGLDARRDFVGRSIEAAIAFGAMAAMTEGLKVSVRSVRPDGSDDRSFPSGHAAVAFTGAELVRMEYGWGWGAGAYAVSASVAALRLYNGRHWLSDVLAGAGIGILSAHLGDWLTDPVQRLLGIDPSRTRLTVTPVSIPGYNPTDFSIAAGFTYSF